MHIKYLNSFYAQVFHHTYDDKLIFVLIIFNEVN